MQAEYIAIAYVLMDEVGGQLSFSLKEAAN
jgi:hypothetical protein